MKDSMSRIPWWLKLSAKMILARLPFGYALWRKLGLFRHGAMDTSDYAIRVFEAHIERSGLSGQLRGKKLLELGPGDSIATAIIAAAHGAEAILVDAGSFVRADVSSYRDIVNRLAEGPNDLPIDLGKCDSIEKLLERSRALYLTDGLQSLRRIESASVDLIFSQAVLEHVRCHEFLETMQECRRILKPGGIASHQVDLRDHLGGALNNLRFWETVWESKLFMGSGFYTNRIRYSEMLELCREAGFTIRSTSTRKWEQLPTPKHKLDKQFSKLPDEELCVSTFDLLLN